MRGILAEHRLGLTFSNLRRSKEEKGITEAPMKVSGSDKEQSNPFT